MGNLSQKRFFMACLISSNLTPKNMKWLDAVLLGMIQRSVVVIVIIAGNQRMRILGSTNGAIMSARRLPKTIATAETKVTPIIIGISTRWIACQAS